MISLSEPFFLGNELKYVKECIKTRWVSTAGKYVDRFENDICRYTKTRYAVACVNGTCGLYIALQLAGVGPNDEVIVPALTFIAPVNAVRYLNAEPVFMDCDDFMNIDAGKITEFCEKECVITTSGLKNKKSGRIIRAIVPVHIFGNPCDIRPIMSAARKYNLKVIEDATESMGSYYTDGAYKGKHTGSVGDIGVYSFNGNKIITTGGGGMIVTNSPGTAKRARYLTTQAKDDPVRYIHHEVGYNFRLTNLQAALGVAQLETLEKIIKIKRKNYELYKKELKDIEGVSLLGVPEGTRPNYWFYSIIVDKTKYGTGIDVLMRGLAAKGIQARPVWYLNHRQKPYMRNQHYRIEKSAWFWERVLNIPCGGGLNESDVKTVVSAIKKLRP